MSRHCALSADGADLRHDSENVSHCLHVVLDGGAVDERVARSWLDHSRHHVDGGCLAGAVVFEQRQDLALVQVEVDALFLTIPP